MIVTSSNFYQVGASLPVDAPSYVRRQADEEFYQKLQAGKFCYVLNSRQMGKSSLRVQTMQRLQKEGTVCAAIDLTGIGKVSEQQWYGGIVYNLSESCKLEDKIDFDWQEWWEKHQTVLSPVQCLSLFIEKVLLDKIQQPIVIFVDEIDKVLSQDFSLDDFFALIRFFQNQRVDNPIFQRLTFALLGVATPGDLIRNKTQTPFNIGEAIELHGFQINEVEPLIKGLQGRFDNPQGIMGEILDWTRGQPFLTQKLCKFMVEESDKDNPGSVKEVVKSRIIQNWESQDDPEHLRTIRDRILSSEQRAGYLLELYQQIQQKGEVAAKKNVEFSELRLSGLVVQREGKLRVYNRVYQQVFNKNWAETQLKNLRPYSEAFRFWVASGYSDESRLLQGKALESAEKWAKGKDLSFQDKQFLAASREKEIALRNQQAELEREKKDREAAEKRNLVLSEANRKAKRRIRNGTVVLVLALLGTVGLGGLAAIEGDKTFQARQDAKQAQQTANDAKKEVQSAQMQVQTERQNAQVARKQAQAQQQNAQVARKQAQAQQQIAKNAQKNAEAAKKEVQSAQMQVQTEQKNAQVARKEAQAQQQIAKNAQKNADDAQREVQSAKEQVKTEQEKAKTARKQAQKEVEKADNAQKQATEAIQNAEFSKKEADKAKEVATSEREKAKNAQKQAEEAIQKAEKSQQKLALIDKEIETVQQLVKLAEELRNENLITALGEAYRLAALSSRVNDHNLKQAMLFVSMSQAYQSLLAKEQNQKANKQKEKIIKYQNLAEETMNESLNYLNEEGAKISSSPQGLQIKVLVKRNQAKLLSDKSKEVAINAYTEAYNTLKNHPNETNPFEQDRILTTEYIELVHRGLLNLQPNRNQQVWNSLKEHFYDRLENSLKLQNWRAADRTTYRMMVFIADREQQGFLDIPRVKNFSCNELTEIDKLWVNYSRGNFGFSVQKKIWEEKGNRLDIKAEDWNEKDRDNFVAFAKAVKWSTRIDWNSDNINLGELKGALPLDGRAVVIPAAIWGILDKELDSLNNESSFLFSRVRACKL